MRESFHVAGGVERGRAKTGEVVERVVAVAGALGVEQCPRLPARRRLPQELALAEHGRSGVEIVTRDVVLREPVARRIAEAHTHSQRVLDQRAGRRAAQIAGAEVAVRADEAAGPCLQRRPAARDVDDAAERVTAEQRALRTAHELDLIDVNELEARGVRIELRDAVDVARDARVAGAGADAAHACVAQLSRGELVEEGVRRVACRIADAAHARVLQCLVRHRRQAHGHLLRILRTLLPRDGDRRQDERPCGLRAGAGRHDKEHQQSAAGASEKASKIEHAEFSHR